ERIAASFEDLPARTCEDVGSPTFGSGNGHGPYPGSGRAGPLGVVGVTPACPARKALRPPVRRAGPVDVFCPTRRFLARIPTEGKLYRPGLFGQFGVRNLRTVRPLSEFSLSTTITREGASLQGGSPWHKLLIPVWFPDRRSPAWLAWRRRTG